MNRPLALFGYIIFITMAVVLIAPACSSQAPATIMPGLAHTLAVRTLVARQGYEYVASATPTPLPITPTAGTLLSDSNPFPATDTPVPSLTPFHISSQLQTGEEGCRNKAEFIEDVTIPDGTTLKPGTIFTKIWKVKNIGTCTWTSNYKLVFTFGDRLNGLSPKPLGQGVPPGGTIDLAVDLVAPKNPNMYQGNWMLEDEQGNQFATGHGREDCFWVAIWVDRPKLGNIFGGCGGGG